MRATEVSCKRPSWAEHHSLISRGLGQVWNPWDPGKLRANGLTAAHLCRLQGNFLPYRWPRAECQMKSFHSTTRKGCYHSLVYIPVQCAAWPTTDTRSTVLALLNLKAHPLKAYSKQTATNEQPIKWQWCLSSTFLPLMLRLALAKQDCIEATSRRAPARGISMADCSGIFSGSTWHRHE